jgi:predicted CoA-binding protein
MAHQNPDDETLKKILSEARTIAMVGASSKPDRPSHGIMKQLLAVGYRVIPVNPTETAVLGQRAYASLGDITEAVDIVDVFRRSEEAEAIAAEAIAVKAKVLWLQLGVKSEAAAALASSTGLTVVMDKCLGAVHRALAIAPKRG